MTLGESLKALWPLSAGDKDTRPSEVRKLDWMGSWSLFLVVSQSLFLLHLLQDKPRWGGFPPQGFPGNAQHRESHCLISYLVTIHSFTFSCIPDARMLMILIRHLLTSLPAISQNTTCEFLPSFYYFSWTKHIEHIAQKARPSVMRGSPSQSTRTPADSREGLLSLLPFHKREDEAIHLLYHQEPIHQGSRHTFFQSRKKYYKNQWVLWCWSLECLGIE